jgi:hypothetical protein
LKGALLLKSGDVTTAEGLLRRACEVMPASFDAHQDLGMLLANAKRPKEALPFLEKALEIAVAAAGTNPDAEVGLAQLRETLARVRDAAR